MNMTLNHTWIEPFPSAHHSSTSWHIGRRLEDHGSTTPEDLSLGQTRTLLVALDSAPAAEQVEPSGSWDPEHSRPFWMDAGRDRHPSCHYLYQQLHTELQPQQQFKTTSAATSVVSKTATLKTKIKTEAPKHERNVNIIELPNSNLLRCTAVWC